MSGKIYTRVLERQKAAQYERNYLAAIARVRLAARPKSLVQYYEEPAFSDWPVGGVVVALLAYVALYAYLVFV